MPRQTDTLLKKEYATWLAAKAAGDPGRWPTKAAWAEAHKLDVKTLYRWDKDPECRRMKLDAMDSLIPDETVTRIIALQTQKALEGNTAAANFVMKFKGFGLDDKAHTVIPDLARMSLAELMALKEQVDAEDAQADAEA